jgi:mannitol-specific phosphotransferase system IIBC component
MTTALLIIHGLVAVALLGAISHQTLATWAPASARPGSFFGRFRTVPSASFANAIVVLYAVSALVGAILFCSVSANVQSSSSAADHFLHTAPPNQSVHRARKKTPLQHQ